MAKPEPAEGNPPPPEGNEGNPPPPEGNEGNGNENGPSDEDIAAVVRRVLQEELPRILAGDEGNPPPPEGNEGNGNAPSTATPRDDEATMYRAVRAAMERLGKEQQLEGRMAAVEAKVTEEAPVQLRRLTKIMGWADPEPKAKK